MCLDLTLCDNFVLTLYYDKHLDALISPSSNTVKLLQPL